MKYFAVPLFIVFAITFAFGQDIVTVGAETANIRSAPNARSSVIKIAKQGDSFPLIAQQGAWNKVRVGKSFGWIHGNSLADILPVLPTPNGPFADPNSRFELSGNGVGIGPGMGTGRGTGQGNGTGEGRGVGTGSGASSGSPEPTVTGPLTANAPLRILSKPTAQYTETARRNQVQGTVRLRVTFLSTGAIGDVIPITELPDGLTQQAVNSAKSIRFQPMRVNGEARSTTKIVEYSFAIY